MISVSLLAAALAAAVPALGNPLLSGYGGPGAGNQAILGSALIGGAGGSGSGGSGGSTGTGGQAGSGVEGGRASGQPRAPKGAGARSAHHPGSGSSASRAPSAPAVGLYSTAARQEVGDQPLGLSGREGIYILIALAALTLAGLITRGLARGSRESAHG